MFRTVVLQEKLWSSQDARWTSVISSWWSKLKSRKKFIILRYFNCFFETDFVRFNFQVATSIQVLAGNEYKMVFKHGEVDFCKVMRRKSTKMNPAAKIIIESMKPTSGNLLHQCPYFGDYEANMTVSKNIVSLIPRGLYKFVLEATNEVDDDFFHITWFLEIKWR